jgi:3-hydroxyacyl-CoA dehydrogenase
MTSINAVTSLTRDGDIAVITLDSPPVNALSATLRGGLLQAVRQASSDASVEAIVLICAGRTFIAGADITEFGKPPVAPGLAEVELAIEAAPKPVVAAIHGTALGGGFETALACHYRVAVPSAKLGLPEVKLGLLPGAGGTQRLPRLVGVERALAMVTSGEMVGAKAAAELGAIDALVEEGRLLEGALSFARDLIAKNAPLRRVRDLDDKLAAARGKPEIFATFRRENARKFRGFEAPESNIRCIEAAVTLPFDQGLAFERDLFVTLMNGDQSAAQRHVFFAERQTAKIPDVPDDTPTRVLKQVGVLGAGTMGGGITMNFLSAGIPVTMVETNQAALDRGIATIRKNYEASAKKGRLTPAEVERRMGLLTGTLEFEALAPADLVIEAVFEEMAVKKQVFTRLDATVKQGAILASNTSYLDIDEIAAMTRRPADVIGLHFFSPANVMRLLEVVRGARTAQDVIATAMQMAKKIGKVAVLARVCHGFIGNRMLNQRQTQANRLILEGAMPWDVDRVLYDFGLPMGPFAMADLAGLDLGWTRAASTGATIRDILCELDRRGQKTGAGFYDYDENRRAKPSPVVAKLIEDFAARTGAVPRQVPDQEILERCLYPMINEGAKILEEGIASRASDIDIVWINGYGWPVYTGGPMFWADRIGLGTVLTALRGYEGKFGDEFKPAALLVRLVEEGKGFKDL